MSAPTTKCCTSSHAYPHRPDDGLQVLTTRCPSRAWISPIRSTLTSGCFASLRRCLQMTMCRLGLEPPESAETACHDLPDRDCKRFNQGRQGGSRRARRQNPPCPRDLLGLLLLLKPAQAAIHSGLIKAFAICRDRQPWCRALVRHGRQLQGQFPWRA